MDELNMELYEKLAHFQWHLQKHHLRRYAETGPMADATRGQGRILALLKMQDGVSTKDLSYLLGIRVSSLNELLAKMEKGGYITREPSEADKRVMLVKLTDKGQSEQQEERDPGIIFSALSDEEKRTFSEYLDRIIATIQSQLGDDNGEDDRAAWMREVRERMGEEMFERMASMQRGAFGSGEGFDPRQRFGGFPQGNRGGWPNPFADEPRKPEQDPEQE
ncbi:MarR family transcriptional regulator [Saccharibacillus sp. CPCC 101409]|uniref:MarR family winged helix-turn-helix transcriptional regulator n=1 Tax=Saccharibacillus sp. CPCC 101409 TaxID=3058041 RepID=UPI002671CCF6|nr:MarR family transcriptional regulator [Saccharibacillus sp. CPCC 101409]MDO3412385.1 MarR family transcriptional regulator [Saccharibacillus sp. CPCC 101409]